MANDSLKQFDDKMVKAIGSFETDLSTIRAGRANPKILDKLSIDYYGVQTPLAQVGNITVPEARVLQITPWESSVLSLIEKSIQQSDLGVNPSSDGKVIRIVFPELTEERRKALTKDIKKKGEDAKVGIRNIRREAVDFVKASEKKKEISEDELKKAEDDIQKLTDKKIEAIDKIVESKNKEIMSI